MLLLGLGSNLNSSFGDRFENIEIAISFLESYQFKVTNKSSFYETFSYPDKKQPKFINSVIEISVDLPPVDLASVLIFVEEKLERKRNKKNEPRTCDIDIIDYYGKVLEFKYKDHIFNTPHEKLIYRNFVLFPLREISPNWTHPKTNEKVDTLINKLTDEDRNSILKINKN